MNGHLDRSPSVRITELLMLVVIAAACGAPAQPPDPGTPFGTEERPTSPLETPTALPEPPPCAQPTSPPATPTTGPALAPPSGPARPAARHSQRADRLQHALAVRANPPGRKTRFHTRFHRGRCTHNMICHYPVREAAGVDPANHRQLQLKVQASQPRRQAL